MSQALDNLKEAATNLGRSIAEIDSAFSAALPIDCMHQLQEVSREAERNLTDAAVAYFNDTYDGATE